MMTPEALRTACLRGEEHPRTRYTDAQVAFAKRLLADAPRVETLKPGTMREIAEKTGIAQSSLLQIRYGYTWGHIEPAPATSEAELV